ncbi:M48 family peptidase [Leucothrix sargassi]|nr:M48 family peptidase [Leucothrix sargassi]
MPDIKQYLNGYQPQLIDQIEQLINEERLGEVLRQRYPEPHHYGSNKALYDYVLDLKHTYMKQSGALSKVVYDEKIHVINHALGLHTQISRVQGGKLKSKNEIRIGSAFKKMPLPLLRMICVHELAHLKEKDHNKAFYKLCQYMEPDYHQLEFDTRLYLTHQSFFGDLYV